MIKFLAKLYAMQVCDECGNEGPAAVVKSRSKRSATRKLNALAREFYPHIGQIKRGRWKCGCAG